MEAPAVRLDRDVILEAAERIVASEGVRALTMRCIGTELGADPTAVYRHFRNKEELLTRLAERLFSTEPDIDTGVPWQEQLRIHIRHAFERYRAHPDLGILLARQPDDLPPLVRITEHTLALLIDGAGLQRAQAAEMAMRRAYALLPADPYPHASATAPNLFSDPDDVFDRTTDLLIDAIERAAVPPRRRSTTTTQGAP